jgi:Na+-driven multidrug efflux pump
LRWRLKPAWNDLEGVKGIFRVGTPSSAAQILIGVYVILMTRLAADFGDSAVAAIGIGGRLDLLAVFPSLAIMTAVLTLVGQNFGAGNPERVRQSVRSGLLTAFVGLSAISVLVFALREPLIGLFRQDAATHASAAHYLGLQCLGYGLVGINIACSGAFQGLGQGMPSLLLTTMRLLAVTLPVAYLLSRRFGEYGLHYAPVIANLVTACVAVIWITAAVRRIPHAAAEKA